MRFFPPEAAIASVLLSKGHRILHTCSPMSLAAAANEAIKRGLKEEPRSGRLISEELSVKLIALRGDMEASVRLRGEDIPGYLIERFSLDAPGIAIDLSGAHLLTPKEQAKLRLQVDLVKGLMKRLRRSNRLFIVEEPLEEKVIYLDPAAEEELEEIEPGRIYVIGGIVDKGNRLPGITSRLASKRDAERKRLTLFGSVIGVPNTLVAIARILIYMFRGVPKDVAILASMPRRAIKARIMRERDERRKRLREELLRVKKGLTSYAEPPIVELSRILKGLFEERFYRLMVLGL